MKTLKDIKRELLAAPGTQATYESQSAEFDIARERIAASSRAGMTRNDVAQRTAAPQEAMTEQEAAEHEIAWFDATLDAAGFFALEHVPPVQAAMLLCRFCPHDSTESEAENCATDCTSQDDFKRLRLTFVDIDKNRPARRSLLDWMAIAAGAGRSVHPWAQRYAKLSELRKPAESTPAPVVADSVNNAPACDLSTLATREQLIEAFGRFTGMDASWFKNITDTPALLAARKVAGQGGRGHITEPLFCPFTVMQWLADSKRRKGRKLSAEKAWELLEKNFPKVYDTRSVADPRAGD